MKTIGVITNKEKDIGLKYTALLVNEILSRGGNVSISSDVSIELGLTGKYADDDSVYKNSDIVICLGGDGTFLKTAREAYEKSIPILGVNLGSLGFLTEVDKNDIGITVENILNDTYCVEERMMLETKIMRGDDAIAVDVALNDIVISRGSLSRILHLKTYIDDVFVDSFPGDGLIISSPTGSTGYSLSAGGPIVEPDIDLMIMTPICPHILYSRSFITTGSRVIRVEVDEKYGHDAMVTVDGQIGYNIKGGDIIRVKKAGHSVKMIRTNSKNFFNILRTKFYDKGEGLR
jgi:NAD+ kinase